MCRQFEDGAIVICGKETGYDEDAPIRSLKPCSRVSFVHTKREALRPVTLLGLVNNDASQYHRRVAIIQQRNALRLRSRQRFLVSIDADQDEQQKDAKRSRLSHPACQESTETYASTAKRCRRPPVGTPKSREGNAREKGERRLKQDHGPPTVTRSRICSSVFSGITRRVRRSSTVS